MQRHQALEEGKLLLRVGLQLRQQRLLLLREAVQHELRDGGCTVQGGMINAWASGAGWDDQCNRAYLGTAAREAADGEPAQTTKHSKVTQRPQPAAVHAGQPARHSKQTAFSQPAHLRGGRCIQRQQLRRLGQHSSGEGIALLRRQGCSRVRQHVTHVLEGGRGVPEQVRGRAGAGGAVQVQGSFQVRLAWQGLRTEALLHRLNVPPHL